VIFFFFQAEDGIRDFHVTGVQTCALPICLPEAPARPMPVLGVTGTGGAGKSSLVDELVLRFLQDFPDQRVGILSIDPTRRRTGEIGRASCRERGEGGVVDGRGKRTKEETT